ncbi:MAG: ROK family protein [Rudaea sp.]|uniref:ROK family protein n=1 Tax=Rudaea sp. TaxID=2136325 RepID=UPI0039E46F84
MDGELGYNERRILDLLRSEGPMSRVGLARATGLTTPSLSRLTQSLTNNRLLLDLHKVRDGQRGKPAQLIKINPDGAFAMGIAVQSEYLSACLIDLEGNLRASVARNLAEADPAVVASLSAKLLDQLLAESGVARRRVIGAGVCMPGVAIGTYGAGLQPGGQTYLPDEYEAWKELDIPAHFQHALHLPTWLENSSKAATLADLYFGAAQRMRNFAAIHIAYGFGGGLIFDRKPYHGTLGRSAEFGGLFPYEEARPSGRDLLAFLAARMKKPPQHIRDLARATIPEPLITEWIARVGPSLVDLSRHLAILLDIEAIVLNGLLPTAVLAPMAQMLRERLPHTIPTSLGTPEIVVSQLAKSGLDLGAASLPLHYVTSATSC